MSNDEKCMGMRQTGSKLDADRSKSKVQIHCSGPLCDLVNAWLLHVNQDCFETLSQNEPPALPQHYHLKLGFLVRVLVQMVLRDR